MGTEPIAFCRAIETYLCQKNDGHLIRVVGPSFELVSRWEEQGVPLKVAFAGIDRYFERYYRKGPRRRPVRIDFCEADVLDVFDEWRRAVGVSHQSQVASRQSRVASHQSPVASHQSEVASHQSEVASHQSEVASHQSEVASHRSRVASRQSLPVHLERVVMRLTAARASGVLGDAFDALIDRVAAELDAARAKAGGVRGQARQALIDRLDAIDASLLEAARALLDDPARAALAKEADEELAGFRATMTAEAYARARAGAIDRLVRERFKLPTIAFTA